MKLTLLLLIIPAALSAQAAEFFTRHFQKLADEKTENVRRYTFEDDRTIIEDYTNNVLEHKGTIYGLTVMGQVNEFAWYCTSLGVEINYRDYFKDVTGVFEFYEKGKIESQAVIRGKTIRYGQVWNAEGQQILTNGNGEDTHQSPGSSNRVYQQYKDSVMVANYTIRTDKLDTLYFIVDKRASPKGGLESFYKDLVSILKYPGMARLGGKEGRVYVQFIIDKQGNLT